MVDWWWTHRPVQLVVLPRRIIQNINRHLLSAPILLLFSQRLSLLRLAELCFIRETHTAQRLDLPMERIELFFILVLQRLISRASHLAGFQKKSKAQQLTSAWWMYDTNAECEQGGQRARCSSWTARTRRRSMLRPAREMYYDDDGHLGLSDSSQ